MAIAPHFGFLRAGELKERRKTLLDAPEAGMVWEPSEEAWENKLAALRSYRRAMGHLAPRQDAVWGEGEATVPVPVQQERLTALGIQAPPPPPSPALAAGGPAKGPSKAQQAFQRGLAALTQWVEREGAERGGATWPR